MKKGGEYVKHFVGYTSNEEFSVGCTGQTVYLYDKDNNELRKFKDIIYAYAPIISPNGKLFVVKSTVGRLAVYSLETFSLIKKFRFSKIAWAQDDGFCFSPDGKLFFNIERQKNDCRSAISIYDTNDFSLVRQVLINEDMSLNHIEFDPDTNTYYVLGFLRDADRIYDYGFVAKFEDDRVKNIIAITDKEYDVYDCYKLLQIRGFTQETYKHLELHDCEIDKLQIMNHTLAKLHAHYRKISAE